MKYGTELFKQKSQLRQLGYTPITLAINQQGKIKMLVGGTVQDLPINVTSDGTFVPATDVILNRGASTQVAITDLQNIAQQIGEQQ